MDKTKRILRQFAEEAKNIFGKTLVQVILYGSYARGDFSESSDIDIMILTTLNDNEIRAIEGKIFDAAYELEFSEGVQISVNIKNEGHFNYWLGALPYYDNIKKEGVIIA